MRLNSLPLQADLSKQQHYLMALEERGCLQRSADTLQPVKVTVLELQKKPKSKPSAFQETYIKPTALGQTGKSPQHPASSHRPFPSESVPSFLWSTYPFGFCELLWLSKLSESICFCWTGAVSLLHPWWEHLIQQLLLFPLPCSLLIDQHFICHFSTQSVTHHKTLLQLRYQHFCKAGPVGGNAFTMASTQVKTHKPVWASLKTAGRHWTFSGGSTDFGVYIEEFSTGAPTQQGERWGSLCKNTLAKEPHPEPRHDECSKFFGDKMQPGNFIFRSRNNPWVILVKGSMPVWRRQCQRPLQLEPCIWRLYTMQLKKGVLCQIGYLTQLV